MMHHEPEKLNDPLDYILRRRGVETSKLSSITGIQRRRLVELRRTQAAPTADEALVIASALNLTPNDLWDNAELQYFRKLKAQQLVPVKQAEAQAPPQAIEPISKRPQMPVNPERSGLLLRKYMTEHSISQMQIERHLNGAVNHTTVNRLCRGQWRRPSVRVLDLICRAINEIARLNITPWDIGWDVRLLNTACRALRHNDPMEMGSRRSNLKETGGGR